MSVLPHGMQMKEGMAPPSTSRSSGANAHQQRGPGPGASVQRALPSGIRINRGDQGEPTALRRQAHQAALEHCPDGPEAQLASVS
jgi:hypothetical protein